MRALSATRVTWICAAALGVAAAAAAVREARAEDPRPVILFPSYLGEVKFEHERHFSEIGLDCKECHHETNAGKLVFSHKNLIPTYRVDCQICHHEGDAPMEPQSCSRCHPSTPAAIADETATSKVAMHTACWKCHEIGRGAAASAKCGSCHKGPRKRW